jgi:hypothetical protein
MASQSASSRPNPLGVFHAVKTTDYQARLRDEHLYYLVNALGREPHGDRLFEVCFGDGTWMLAVEADLEPFEDLPADGCSSDVPQ